MLRMKCMLKIKAESPRTRRTTVAVLFAHGVVCKTLLECLRFDGHALLLLFGVLHRQDIRNATRFLAINSK